MSRHSSRLLLRPDGTVVVRCGEEDAQDIAGVSPGSTIDTTELEIQVTEAVESSWQAFRRKDASSAERKLGESPESEIFIAKPETSRADFWRRVTLIVLAVLMVVAMILSWLSES